MSGKADTMKTKIVRRFILTYQRHVTVNLLSTPNLHLPQEFNNKFSIKISTPIHKPKASKNNKLNSRTFSNSLMKTQSLFWKSTSSIDQS